MIFTVFSTKGGTGKTPFAISMSVAMAKTSGTKVALVDCDGSQASAFSILKQREKTFAERRGKEKNLRRQTKIDVFWHEDQDSATLPEFLSGLVSQYDHIFLDTGGHDSAYNRKALRVADTVIVPIRPLVIDFYALGKMLNIIEAERDASTESFPGQVFIVLTQSSPHSRHKADVLGYIQQLKELVEEMQMQDLVHIVSQATVYRQAYVNAMENGLGITEAGDEKAEAEFNRVFSEIVSVLIRKQ